MKLLYTFIDLATLVSQHLKALSYADFNRLQGNVIQKNQMRFHSAGSFLLWIVTFLLLTTLPLHGQECAVKGVGQFRQRLLRDMPQIRQLEQDFASRVSLRDEEWIDVPVQFHVVRTSEGLTSLNLQDLATGIDNLNEIFQPIGFRFFQCGEPLYVDNTEWYDFNWPEDEDKLAARSFRQRVINVYCVYRINDGAASGYAYFPEGEKDIVLMTNSSLTGGMTFPHEMGHYFGLLHTHGRGNCPTAMPATDELVNGANCDTAGDLVCDTPADPGLSGLNCEQNQFTISCIYNGTYRDANGQLFQPDPSNIMAYSGRCRTRFSNGQYRRMYAVYEAYRGYLTCPANNCPPPSGIRVERAGYSHLWMEWDLVENAQHYVLRNRKSGSGDNTWVITDNWKHPGIIWVNRTPCTNYELQIKTVCAEGEGDWSPILNMETAGCGDSYCYSYGYTAGNWIQAVMLGDLSNNSGRNYGYANFTDTTIMVQTGTNLEVALESAKSNGEPGKTVYWRVWVDWNQDRLFDDAELVLEREGQNDGRITGSIAVPAGAVPGATRLRVMMSPVRGLSPCDIAVEKDVEDYQLKIIAPTVLSAIPERLLFPARGIPHPMDITSNTTWAVTASAAWLTLSKSAGSGNETIYITAAANTATADRTASIALSGGGITRTIAVSQAGAAPDLVVDPPHLDFPAHGASHSLSINANTAWTARTSASWLTLDKTGGTGNGTLYVTAEANASVGDRNASITLSGGGLTRTVAVSQAAGAPWGLVKTGEDHTLILPQTIISDIAGDPLVSGDYIGCFFRRDGEDICGGFVIWNGRAASLTAYGDDPGTAIKDGFAAGEPFRFRVFRSAVGQELAAQALFGPVGGVITHGGAFATDGISLVTALRAGNEDTHDLTLREGWNMVSSYLLPTEPDLLSLFEAVGPSVSVIKNGAGKVAVPEFGINEIGAWNVTEGYRVKVDRDVGLPLRGQRIDPSATPVALRPGWQMIAYLRRSPAPATQEFADVTGAIDLVKDNEGNSYIPAFGIDQIGSLRPGQGYKVKASAAAELRYSPDGPSAAPVPDMRRDAGLRYFTTAPFRPTGRDATLVLPFDVAGSLLSPGDEVAVLTAEGRPLDAARYEGRTLALIARGDDPDTPEPDGLMPGEPYRLRAWRAADGGPLDLAVRFEHGDGYYSDDAFAVIGELTPPAGTTSIIRTRLYPNPTRDRLTLEVEGVDPAAVEVHLTGADGRNVALHNPGNRILQWSLGHLPPGVYFLQIVAPVGARVERVEVVR